MKKLIVMVVLVCLSVVTFSAETNCGPTDSDKTKQTTPTKQTKKEKKVKKIKQKVLKLASKRDRIRTYK